MNEHYAAVISDLESRRKPIISEIDTLKKKLGDLDALLAGIGALAGGSGVQSPMSSPIVGWDRDTYTDMSMRWAIMYMLAEHTQGRLATGEIAARMVAGGFTETPNFNSKVSAILSQMQTKFEVSRTDEGWGITASGEGVWRNIKTGDKFLNRHKNGVVDLE